MILQITFLVIFNIYAGTSGENSTSGLQAAEPAILGVPGASAESEYGLNGPP